MSVRAGVVAVIACAVLSVAAACSSSDAGGSAGLSGVTPPVSPSTPVTSATPTSDSSATPAVTATPAATVTVTAPAMPSALTCGQLKNALVGSTTLKYNGYHDSIPLGGGVWSGEDGNTVKLQAPCAIGDLDGDGAKDAVGVVTLSNGGTGTFWTLVVWRNVKGKPVCTALADLSDRNPVQSISISGGKATVVYLTRTDDAPMAEVNIKRTAVYKLSGHKFLLQSHTDVPFSES